MIRPLVQEAKNLYGHLLPFIIYTVGTVISGLTMGIVIGSLGSMIIPTRWLILLTIVVASVGIGLSLCDLGVAGMRTPTLWRQTCPLWWRTFGHHKAIFLWGVDLGLGVTTIRTASLYWVVVLIVLVLASPTIGALALGGYGLAIALNLGASVAFSIYKDREGVVGEIASIRAARLFAPLKKVLAIILLLWCILLFILIVIGSRL